MYANYTGGDGENYGNHFSGLGTNSVTMLGNFYSDYILNSTYKIYCVIKNMGVTENVYFFG